MNSIRVMAAQWTYRPELCDVIVGLLQAIYGRYPTEQNILRNTALERCHVLEGRSASTRGTKMVGINRCTCRER